MTSRQLVGREAELARLLDALQVAGSRMVVVSPPGMGKSELVGAYLSAVRALPITVLACRPTESEAELGFNGLADLLAELPETEYDELPAPQRSGLRSALLLDDSQTEVDPRAVAAGVLGVLRRLAAGGPVVVVMDDAHWLDAATVVALRHALRRAPDNVLVVAATRPVPGSADVWLGPAVERVDLAPLSTAALFYVVQGHLGVALEGGALRRIGRESGGNPLYALEFARHGEVEGSASFDRLLGDRLAALPRSTRLALLTAAVSSEPTVEVVSAARGVSAGDLLEALDPAVGAGIVRIGERVLFSHPLYMRAVVDSSAVVDRKAAHTGLADLEPAPEARVRHLSEVIDGPSEELAAAADDAATDARQRGAVEEAIDLLALAAARSVDPQAAAERSCRLGDWLALAGRVQEADPHLVRARQLGQGEVYWEATLLLCQSLFEQLRPFDAQPLIDELDHGDLPPELKGRYLVDIRTAWPPGTSASQQLQQLDSVMVWLDSLPDQEGLHQVRVMAMIRRAYLTEYLALGPAEAIYEEAAILAAQGERMGDLASDEGLRAFRLFQAGRLGGAREMLEARLARAEVSGDEIVRWRSLCMLALVDGMAGRWGAADEWLRLAHDASIGSGEAAQFDMTSEGVWLRGLRGDLEGAESQLARLIRANEANSDLHSLALHRSTLGRIRLAHGRNEEAREALEQALADARAMECLDPAHLPLDISLVRARLLTGAMDEAAAHVADTRARAERIGRTYTLAQLAVWDVIVQASNGELDAAAERLPGVLDTFTGITESALELAILQLAAGRVYRRAKQKRRAHEALSMALDIFEGLPCPPYADQARAELARVGLRPTASEGLTPSELAVAELAAAGLRNQEIAERVFASPKTVEATLSRAYRKLSIRSRAELARALETLGSGSPE